MMIKTKGKCLTCHEEYAPPRATTHLKGCSIKSWEPSRSMKEGFLARISWDEEPNLYWMFVTLPKTSSLEMLDHFLRKTWLECCGHLSCFRIGRREYYSRTESGNPSRLMLKKISQVLAVGDKCQYLYDFGSSTYLKIDIIQASPACPQRKVTLLMKNDPPDFPCESCDKKSSVICSMCGSTACSLCSKKHSCVIEEEDSYMLMPLVNSPRAGVCGYDGHF